MAQPRFILVCWCGESTTQGYNVLNEQMNEKAVWDIVKASDKFHREDLRSAAINQILIQPKMVLQERPPASDELLQEVLGSDFLCLSDEELLDLLIMWEDADEGCMSKFDLIAKHVRLEKVPAEKIKSMVLMPEFGFCKPFKTKTIRSEYTDDVLCSLKERCKSQHGEEWDEVFLSDWVNIIHTEGAISDDVDLVELAYQCDQCELEAGNWVEWRFPLFAVKLLGISINEGAEVAEGTHFIVSCEKKGSPGSMQEVFRSEEHGQIFAEQSFPCQCDFVANCFRVEVTFGTLDVCCFTFEGFLLDDED